VRDVRVAGSLGDEQLDRLGHVIEEPDPAAEHHGREIDVDGIQPGWEQLLGKLTRMLTRGTRHEPSAGKP
jgi:hypothetical protein